MRPTPKLKVRGAAADASGVTYNLRFYPLCQQARALVQQGAIGEPRLMHGSFLQDWLLYPTDWNWRLVPEFSGASRAVADVGSHWCDCIQFISGRKITKLCAPHSS
jgi:predicted dehydrogenase